MGTTAEKLSYLNETKTKIKNALETPYNVFRDYPAMIKKYIDNQPTKIVTNGICNNAVELPIVSLKSDGNSEQKTTEGKQLFNKDNPNFSATGSNAKYVSIKNGFKIVCNKDETTWRGSAFNIRLGSINDFIGTLRIKTTAIVSGNGTFRPGLALFYGNANNFSDSDKVAEGDGNYGGTTNFDIESNITEQSDLTHLYLIVYGNGSGSAEHYMNDGDYTIYDNFIITLNNDDMTYEPYTGGISSPNPDYRQDVEVIDGYNIFDGEFTTNGVWKDDGTINYVIQSKLYWRTDFIKIPNKNIYFSSKQLNIFSSAILLEFDTDKKYITSNKIYQVNSNLNNVSLNESTRFIAIQWNLQNATEIESLFTEFRITEGMSSKPYLPYGSIGLKQSGKNKFDNFKEYSYSNSNLNTTSLNNGIKIEKKGGFGLWVFDNLENLDEKIVRAKSKFNDGGSIAIGLASLDGTSRTVMKENTKSDTVSSFVIPKITDDKKYLAVWLYGTDNSEISYEDLIITIDNEDMTYEPYHEPKVIEINLNGNTLAKVGDVKDILKVNRNGEVEIEKNTWKDTINTSSLITLNKGNKGLVFVTSKNKTKSMSDSDYLITNAQRNRTFNDGTVYQNPANFVFVGNSSDTLESIQAKFNGGEILYQLETPQTIKLPSINPIELWQGTNIFKLITNLETNFEVEYVVDKDSMLAEVQTAMLNAEIEI